MTVTPENVTSSTCLSCGACCVALHDQPAFADLTSDDEKRLSKRFVRLHVLRTSTFDHFAAAIDGHSLPPGAIKTSWRTLRTGPFKGVSACACVALRGSLFSHVRCSIYARRPRVCHEAVKPGDETCLEIRNLFLEMCRNPPAE